MKFVSSRGFTLMEILVVIAIIGILSSIVIVGSNLGQQQQDDLKTQQLIHKISTAIDAYYDTTLRYPDDLGEYAPNGQGVKSDFGYLAMLQQGYVSKKMVKGSLEKEAIVFIDLTEEEKFDNDTDHAQDHWGNKIQYRKAPRNTLDFQKRFKSSGKKIDVLSFPGNPKRFNLWSPGADRSDDGQEYKAHNLSDGKGRDYKSGGYSHEDEATSEDARDDIRNW